MEHRSRKTLWKKYDTVFKSFIPEEVRAKRESKCMIDRLPCVLHRFGNTPAMLRRRSLNNDSLWSFEVFIAALVGLPFFVIHGNGFSVLKRASFNNKDSTSDIHVMLFYIIPYSRFIIWFLWQMLFVSHFQSFIIGIKTTCYLSNGMFTVLKKTVC